MKHGHTWRGGCSPTYSSWMAMVSRCYRPSSGNYHKYGGAGIAVCDEWRSFASFLKDMGVRPDGTSLDRIDSAKNYTAGNCRWATTQQQSENRSCVHLVEIDGERRTVAEWARRARVSDTAMLYRVRRGITGAALLRPSHHGSPL